VQSLVMEIAGTPDITSRCGSPKESARTARLVAPRQAKARRLPATAGSMVTNLVHLGSRPTDSWG
jgi:hypothetical protein